MFCTANFSPRRTSLASLQFAIQPVDNSRLANLCGINDDNIKLLGQILDVRILRRGENFRIIGESTNLTQARTAIKRGYANAYQQLAGMEVRALVSADDPAMHRTAGTVRRVRGRNDNQRKYLAAVRQHDITFGVGASGTGKTFLAMACALEALETEAVRRIVLVRPAVEAGENLGFLPGDPVQKVNPYLRPLQDALHELCSDSFVDSLQRNDRIELAPLAYMRGRTLANSFVVLDEAQNTTCTQMKMFLTRLGSDSRCVVTGDNTQIDLPAHETSGLVDILRIIESVDGCAVVHFAPGDTMRHPVVGKILDAYDS